MEVVCMKFRKYIIKALLLFGIWSITVTSPGILSAATNSDYAAMPPFMSTSLEPNVLIVLDNSGSMNDEAYATTYDPTQFSSGQYYGLFDATKYYQYNGTRWEPISGYTTTIDSIPSSGPSGTSDEANPIASGNLLNWATMSRISVAKKLLIGGKANPRSVSAGQTVKVNGETTWGFSKTFDNTSSANLVTPFTGNYRYRVSSTARFYIEPVVAGTDTFYASPSTNYYIPAGWTVSGAASAWEAVDDTPPYTNDDSDTTYIQAQGTANPAMFDYDFPAASKTGTITNVGVRVVAKSNCSSTTTRRTRAVLRISDVNYDSGYTSISTSYPATVYSFDWNNNHATGAAW